MKTYMLVILSVLLVVGCRGEDSKSSSVEAPVENPSVERPSEELPETEEPNLVEEPPTIPEVEDWVHLTWMPPLSRVDGSPISMGEIDGYIILYGMSPDAMNHVIPIQGGNVKEHKVEDLADGTWYFAVKVVDTDGLESGLSPVVSKIIYNPIEE